MKSQITEVANDPAKIRVVNKKIVTDKSVTNKAKAASFNKKAAPFKKKVKITLNPPMMHTHGAFNIKI